MLDSRESRRNLEGAVAHNRPIHALCRSLADSRQAVGWLLLGDVSRNQPDLVWERRRRQLQRSSRFGFEWGGPKEWARSKARRAEARAGMRCGSFAPLVRCDRGFRPEQELSPRALRDRGPRRRGGRFGWSELRLKMPPWITPKTALRSALSRSAVAGRKKVSRPAFVAPGRVNGPSCGTGGISGTTDWRCPVARAG